jgi:serine/threonine-protein kinase
MILYECLAGRLPYDGDNALVVMSQHVTVSPPPLNRFVRDVPVALEETVLKAIRRSAGARWSSMELFAAALQHLEQEDINTLQAEREQQETSAGDGGVRPQLSIPPWRVA